MTPTPYEQLVSEIGRLLVARPQRRRRPAPSINETRMVLAARIAKREAVRADKRRGAVYGAGAVELDPRGLYFIDGKLRGVAPRRRGRA